MVEAKRFKNLEELVEALLSESRTGTGKRFSVRLLLVPDFESLRNLRNILRSRKVKEYFLEDIIEDELSWLYPEVLASKVREISLKASEAVIHSVGEAVRFYTQEELSDLILNKLLLIEGGRVFIPLAGMAERILDVYRKFPRKGEYTPLYILEGDGMRLKLYLINPRLRLPFNTVRNFKRLLSLWMDGRKDMELVSVRSIYLKSENAKPDSAIESIRIDSYGEMLGKVFKFKDHLEYKGELFLEFLVRKVCDLRANNISDLLGDKAPQDFKDFLRIFFSEKDRNMRMLLANYAHGKWEELREILDIDPYKLAQNLWLSSIDPNRKKEYIETMLSMDPSLDRALCETFRGTMNKRNLLGVLSCEKEKAIELFGIGEISEEELKGLWKGFEFYLDTPWPSNMPNELEILHEYIKEYKLCKLRNQISDRLKDLVLELNSSKDKFYGWYYQIEEIRELVEPGVKVIQLDAVGFEWAGFIVNVLKEKGVPIEDVKVARAGLPTITEVNKLEGALLIGDFDTLVHGICRYPIYIVEEMEKLYEIVSKEIELGGRLIITADHGTTALSRIDEPLGFNENGEGVRYIIGEASLPDTIVFSGDRLYTVALTHRSISRKPPGEVHGGATPEEIIVPFIIVGEKAVSYRLELGKKEITARTLKFRLFPEPKIPVVVKLGSSDLQAVKEGKWFVVRIPHGIRAGNYRFKVCIGAQEVSEEVTIKGGLEERDIL